MCGERLYVTYPLHCVRVLYDKMFHGTDSRHDERIFACSADTSDVLQGGKVLWVHVHALRGKHLHDVPETNGVGERGVRFHEGFARDVLVDVSEFVGGKRELRAQEEQRVEKVPARHENVVAPALLFEHGFVAAEAVVGNEHGVWSHPLGKSRKPLCKRNGSVLFQVLFCNFNAAGMRRVGGGHLADDHKRASVGFNSADAPYAAIGCAVVNVADKLKVDKNMIVGRDRQSHSLTK